MKDTRPLIIFLSLAFNRWLSPVADSGPWGANWSDPWPLALMEGVAGGQACKGYPLYPSARTAAQSWRRHPARIGGSLRPPTIRIMFVWSIWDKEQTPWCSVAPVRLWPALSILDFPKGILSRNEQKVNTSYKNRTVVQCGSNVMNAD